MATNTPKQPLKALIQDMNAYHARTGGYKPEDVARVIGDQRKGIGLSVPSALPGQAAQVGAAANSKK